MKVIEDGPAGGEDRCVRYPHHGNVAKVGSFRAAFVGFMVTATGYASICGLIAATAMLGTFAVAARAAGADNAPSIVVPFPDTANNLHVYLFNLKKNEISLRIGPEEFCKNMGYGHAVLGQPREIGNDNKGRPEELEWVICRFKIR